MRIVALVFTLLTGPISFALNAPNIRLITSNSKDQTPPKVIVYELGAHKSLDIDIPGWDHKCKMIKGEGFKENGVTFSQHYFRCTGKGGTIMQNLVCPSKDIIAQHSLTIETPKVTNTVLLRCNLP